VVTDLLTHLLNGRKGNHGELRKIAESDDPDALKREHARLTYDE
jgi:hypothetical protein